MKLLRYMERIGISYQEALDTPNEVIERAFLIWSLDVARDKLDIEKRKQ